VFYFSATVYMSCVLFFWVGTVLGSVLEVNFSLTSDYCFTIDTIIFKNQDIFEVQDCPWYLKKKKLSSASLSLN
jgi:hypothetical protein